MFILIPQYFLLGPFGLGQVAPPDECPRWGLGFSLDATLVISNYSCHDDVFHNVFPSGWLVLSVFVTLTLLLNNHRFQRPLKMPYCENHCFAKEVLIKRSCIASCNS